MALIHCPECGQEISDKAKICPHCGYAIQEAKAELEQTAQGQQNAPARPNIIDPEMAWGTACPQEKTRKKVFWILRAIFVVIAMVPVLLLMFTGFDIIYPLNSDTISNNPISLLQYLADYDRYIKNVFIASIVLHCISFVFGIVVMYGRVIPITKWMTKRSFNVIPFLGEKDIKIMDDKWDPYWAAYCMLSPNGKIVYGLDCLAGEVRIVGPSIFLTIMFRDFCSSKLAHFMSGTEWTVDFNSIILISVIAVVVLISSMVIHIICKKACKNFLTNYAIKNKTK